MKPIRKVVFFTLCSLLTCSLLLGCTLLIPDEYTDGVKLDRDYPEDDMPIMDDAIVYYSDGDDESITIKYGVSDDLDDVVDFYKDHFEDNDIVLDDESDRSTRYNAEGSYKDFMFDVKVTKASGEYEEKVFETTVKIQIEFMEEPISTVEIDQDSLEDDIIGFWRQESSDNEAGVATTYDLGIAFEFAPLGQMNLYGDFEYFSEMEWSIIDESTILVTTLDGHEETVTITLEKRSALDYLIWVDSTGTYVFFRDSVDALVPLGDYTPPELTADEQLTAAIADVTWYYIHHQYADGQIASSSTGSLIYHSDGTLEDVFDDQTLTGNWYISDGRLYCDYSDDTSSSWDIEITNEGGTAFLYYFSDSNPGAFWLYADDPYGDGTPAQSATYTTDADVANYLTGVTWNGLYYLFADGTTETLSEDTMFFDSDETFSETYAGGSGSGRWRIDGGLLYMAYANDENPPSYPVFIAYDAESGAFYLYLGDLEEGYEGNSWVYTTYLP